MSSSQGLMRKAHFLGTKIKRLRKRNNLTLEDLSVRCLQLDREAGPSVSYLSMIENGKRAPSPRLLGIIADIFQKDLNWFYDETLEEDAIELEPRSGGIEGIPLEPGFLFSNDLLQTAIPELLDVLELSGSVVTIDAMGTQRAIAQQIIDQGGDYVLALKSNQGLLYEDVRTYFDEAQAHDFQGIVHDYYKQTDGGHGRIEVRECWCSDDVAWLPQLAKWKGLRSIVLVEARRREGEKESLQRRFYIASVAA